MVRVKAVVGDQPNGQGNEGGLTALVTAHFLACRDFFLSSAHCFLWAAAIRFLAGELSLRRGLGDSLTTAARFLAG